MELRNGRSSKKDFTLRSEVATIQTPGIRPSGLSGQGSRALPRAVGQSLVAPSSTISRRPPDRRPAVDPRLPADRRLAHPPSTRCRSAPASIPRASLLPALGAACHVGPDPPITPRGHPGRSPRRPSFESRVGHWPSTSATFSKPANGKPVQRQHERKHDRDAGVPNGGRLAAPGSARTHPAPPPVRPGVQPIVRAGPWFDSPVGRTLLRNILPKYVKHHSYGSSDRRPRPLRARTFSRSGTNQSRGRPGSTTAFRASGSRMRPEVRLSRAACLEMPPIQFQASLDEREDTD